MAFIGVRASESLSRSEYDYVSLGEKHKGQYSCNPILEWNSAELYAYIYLRQLYLNEAYKKMNVHCIDCNPLNMSFDGVHLSEKGHKEFALKMSEYMKKEFC